MTPQQLLIPRYEVIADWPGRPKQIVVGDVLTTSNDNCQCLSPWIVIPKIYSLITNPQNYPANLRPLHWSERRDLKDMPEYVKWASATKPFLAKVIKWENCKTNGWGCSSKSTLGIRFDYVLESDLEPATETDYLNYINANK